MIIDSPGVESDDETDQMVIQYLPQAFAFIYVINSMNGGGIQKSKVSATDSKIRIIHWVPRELILVLKLLWQALRYDHTEIIHD